MLRSIQPLTEVEREQLRSARDEDLCKLFGRPRAWLRAQKREMLHKDAAPAGFRVNGESILYDAKGDEIARWVKTSADKQRQLDALLAEAAAIAKPFAKSIPRIASPTKVNADLLVVYPMGDPHIGMHAWAEETGTDFNLETAERNLVAAVDHLTSIAPPAEQALIVNLGDFFHTDSFENRTRRSGAVLDTDGRWSKILRCGIRTMKRCVERALERHRKVRVINEIGNHDDQTSLVLSAVLEEAYGNNPRVEVDTSPAAFHYHRFGKVLIGITHGNNTKPDQLGQVMAADRPSDWGETAHRYWYCGHIHHDTVKEVPGCKVESFRTLAPRDAWHASMGYRSGRDMKCLVLHRQHGEIMRHTVEAGML